MPREPVVFTSWKEIASYLGKGVRTVQRWEAQFGLPVQRPDVRQKGVVRATQNDLDRWVSTRWSPRKSAAPEAIRLTALKARDEGIRIRGEAIQKQLMLGFTLCEMAALSIAFGHFAHAQKIVRRLWPSAHTIARHLDEPHHTPQSSISQFRAELQRLEGRITEIEAQLNSEH